MSKSLLIAFSLLSLAAAGYSQAPPPKIQTGPIRSTSTSSGKQMFSTYCAVCHGSDGKGGGPAAAALKTPPADLTRISEKNKGVFPTFHISSVLQSGVDNPAHGTSEMPIWGDLMRSLNGASSDGGQGDTKQRIYNLTEYLKQIQQK